MALIKCPECGADISDKAVTCPRCAYPIARGKTKEAQTEKVRLRRKEQIIKKTPKKYKLQVFIAILLVLAGFFLIIFNISGQQINVIAVILGLLATVGGFVWLIIAEFSSWWHQN